MNPYQAWAIDLRRDIPKRMLDETRIHTLTNPDT